MNIAGGNYAQPPGSGCRHKEEMNKDVFKPECRSTGIGSLPFTDASEACSLLLDSVDFPFWPQLPCISFREQMIPQYAEGLPSVEIDDAARRVRFILRESSADEIAAFFDRHKSGELGSFAISPEFSKGFAAFAAMAAPRRWPAVKGQITGPLTYSLSVCDGSGRPACCTFELLDIIRRLLARKAQWQVAELGRYADRVLIFIDEPALAAFGSTCEANLSRADMARILNDLIASIHDAGALAGIHACGSADWALLAATQADIISFDAFDHARSIAESPDRAAEILQRGGSLAWGIVPTSEALAGQTVAGLRSKLFEAFAPLEQHGIPRPLLLERCLLAPSCGAGNLTVTETRRLFCLLGKLSRSLREEFFPA